MAVECPLACPQLPPPSPSKKTTSSSTSIPAIPKEQSVGETLHIVNCTKYELYLRVRCGQGENLSVLRPGDTDPSAPSPSFNRELFMMPPISTIRLPVSALAFPLRIRLWKVATGYKPAEDYSPVDGKATSVCPQNIAESWGTVPRSSNHSNMGLMIWKIEAPYFMISAVEQYWDYKWVANRIGLQTKQRKKEARNSWHARDKNNNGGDLDVNPLLL
eukprot:TRINITY_DN8340_c0_g1_i1.p1 TRINITY_DN8340_c0_g1~~TRINITY_DN8340_c0_g1_i1.p1  ORF type:complete len:217 (-),score=27.81 TRINITY_DN8340_c0_g1_i1:66-716(-)